MLAFGCHLPVEVTFRDGAIHELGRVLGGVSALVVVDEAVAGHPDVRAALANVRAEVVVKPPGEPTFALADGLAAAVAAGGHGAVVGIGGGSSLDAAKAARVVAAGGGSSRDYAAGRTPEPPGLPLVLCPTTAGTGSEVSGASVLSDEAGRKVGFGHPHLRAQHALVDPVLTHGLPPGPTAQAGIDALAQAIGACTVLNASPLSRAFGLEACHLIARSLPRAVADGSDADARRTLAAGSLAAGLAMNLADCAADHALAHALGSLCHLPHGLCVALVVCETLEVSRAACDAALGRVAHALEAQDAVAGLRALITQVGLPTAREAGVDPALLDRLTDAALDEQAFFLGIDAHDWTHADVRGAFVAALSR